jgi:hypothetical protein
MMCGPALRLLATPLPLLQTTKCKLSIYMMRDLKDLLCFNSMIWLSGLGKYVSIPRFETGRFTQVIILSIQPVGSQITSGVQLAGHNWNLWRGPNQNWEVLSFVSQDGDITDFNADLNDFFSKRLAFFRFSPADAVLTFELFPEYLTQNQGMPSSQVRFRISISGGTSADFISTSSCTMQYVQAIQAGTEPFTGSASLSTTAYSVSI